MYYAVFLLLLSSSWRSSACIYISYGNNMIVLLYQQAIALVQILILLLKINDIKIYKYGRFLTTTCTVKVLQLRLL